MPDAPAASGPLAASGILLLLLLGPGLAAPASAAPLAVGAADTRERAMPDFDPLAGQSGTSGDQGRGAVFATLANLLGRLYDGAKVKLGMDAPDAVPAAALPATRSLQTLTGGTVAVQRLSLGADPRQYLSRGLAADTAVSVLGRPGRLGVQLGTEQVRQSFSLQVDCRSLWMPNDIAGHFSASHGDSGGRGPWAGYVGTSWGTACAEGQTGWRVTAGLRDYGTDSAGSLGLEYRPARFTAVSRLTGLNSLRAGITGERGQVGAEMTMGTLQGQPLRLDAGYSWQEDGPSALRLGTKVRF